MHTTSIGAATRAPYWQEDWNFRQVAALAPKYAALSEAWTLLASERAPKLREIARAWPGALREGELIESSRGATRLRLCQLCREESPRTRAAWVAGGEFWERCAISLWSDLHALLSAQRDWRLASTEQTFLEWCGDGFGSPWPRDIEVLAQRAGPAAKSRQAYLWLAHCAGWSLRALNFALFARDGSWDARPGDPPSSREGFALPSPNTRLID